MNTETVAPSIPVYNLIDLQATHPFWLRVREMPSGCWEWHGCHTKSGYGSIGANGRSTTAHRFAWELTTGSIDIGLCICHRCDNKPCCNPSHLFLGTIADNNHDRQSKGRSAMGVSHGFHTNPDAVSHGAVHYMAKLDDDAVRAIRLAYANGEMGKTIAARFGVAQGTISRIATMKGWKHVI